MGFGLLFFGYFISFLLSLNAYGSVFALIGYYVIFSAIQKLSEYKSSLSRCVPFLILLTVCDGINTFKLLFLFEASSTLNTVISTVYLVSTFLFNVFLFLSIISLGKDTEVDEVVSLAKVSIGIIAMYFASNLAMIAFPAVPVVLATAMILRLLYPLFALALIYRCFRFICSPEDVDMPTKPSRFKFINAWRERQAKREDEARTAREEQLKRNASRATHKKKK